MTAIISFLKEFLHVSSPLAIVLLFGGAAALVWARPSNTVRRLLLLVAVGIWLITTPAGSNLLVAGLARGLSSVRSPADAPGADVVVVLGGGAYSYQVGDQVLGMPNHGTILRALEAARVYRAIGARLVIASGGRARAGVDLKPESETLRDVLVRAGVPPARICEEWTSTTTREQARELSAVLAKQRVTRFVLVTSATHMRRALGTFRAQGLDPIGSMAPVRSEHLAQPPFLLPNGESMLLSDTAVYDYVATAYYWVNGWTAPRPARSPVSYSYGTMSPFINVTVEPGAACGEISAAGAVRR